MFITRYIKENPFINEIGVFLVHTVLGLFRLFRFSYREENDKIGIVALHRLGDSVFTIPAIKQIIKYYKNISIICFEETTLIYRVALKAGNFIELSHKDFLFTDRIAKSKVRKKIKKLNFSTIYDLTGTIRSASLIFNNPAKEIIGLNEPYYSTVYTKFINVRKKPHIIDNYLDVVRLIKPFDVIQERVMQNNNWNEYILVHPFASVSSKEWGLKKFISLAEALNSFFKTNIVALPAQIPSDVISELNKKKIKVIETQTTTELISVIERSLLLIGNDSGPVHIANLLGKPTFTIYGPTNPEFHRPFEGWNEYIINEIPCSPKPEEKFCFTFGGVYCPSNECMQNLKYNLVEHRVKSFVNKVLSSETNLIQ